MKPFNLLKKAALELRSPNAIMDYYIGDNALYGVLEDETCFFPDDLLDTFDRIIISEHFERLFRTGRSKAVLGRPIRLSTRENY